MTPEELREAGIAPTTIRIAVGDEDPRQLFSHVVRVAELILDPVCPGFSGGFLKPAAMDALYQKTYLEIHRRWLEAQPTSEQLLE
jgi:hypothetical protein